MKVKKNSLKKLKKGNFKKYYEFVFRFCLFVSMSFSKDKILFEVQGWKIVNVFQGQILIIVIDYIFYFNLYFLKM